MIDYIIVGCGIAGICFAEIAMQNKKSIMVYDNNSQNSSNIAAGIYNPVILKRFSEVWNAKLQINFLNNFYPLLENRINTKIDFKIPVIRKFFSVEEQNNWFSASDKQNLSEFISTKLLYNKYTGIESPVGFGEVLHTGYVDTKVLLNKYQQYLKDTSNFIEDNFDHSKLEIQSDFISYNNIKAKHIIFAEGFGLHHNPFFKHLPLDGTKGEILIIRAPNLDLNCILNSSVYILPLGNSLFKVGATYNWEDKTNAITEQGKKELIDKIKELLNCDFEIIEQLAGIRPTVKDRKPLVGTHSQYKNLHILNGFGTRGVMFGPSLANDLFQNIENEIPLNDYIDIKRFDNKGFK